MLDDDFNADIENSLVVLRAAGVVFDEGLSDAEIDQAQQQFGFWFPPDLRAFLQSALPVAAQGTSGATFPNWRKLNHLHLQPALDWPMEGIAFDIEHSNFWLAEWGSKPDSLQDATAIARRHVSAAPKLIPIYSHRYIPTEPFLAGNPVFSVYQTDIIYYGQNLWDYFSHEFAARACRRGAEQPPPVFRTIAFWSDLAS